MIPMYRSVLERTGLEITHCCDWPPARVLLGMLTRSTGHSAHGLTVMIASITLENAQSGL